MTQQPNACDAAIERHREALQAIADVESDRKDSPVVLSRAVTGRPTMDKLRAELAEAEAEVSRACQKEGPTK